MTDSLYPFFPILIVDDETITLESLEFVLNAKGINNLILCHEPLEVMNIVSQQEICVILLDLLMPKVSGEDILLFINEKYPEVPVIIISGVNDIDTAVKCMKFHAFDYIIKPLDENRLIPTVRRAIEFREMQNEIIVLKQRLLSGDLDLPDVFSDIITQNREMVSIFQYIEAVAPSDHPVLITGETGVGKELIAKSIHKCSKRKGHFVALNIAGLDESVFSDTLFGHLKGAFTDAKKSRRGLIEKASGGTLFLDEIGELSIEIQIKLLRIIQEREYFPLGSDIPIRTNVRIIAATNQNLENQIESELFRNDLYYRLKIHHIHIPPLRKRPEDIPLLLDFFLEMAAGEFKKKKPTPPKELATHLVIYDFPGNVRELKAMVHDAVANHTSKMMNMKCFGKAIKHNKKNENAINEINSDDNYSFSAFERLPTLKEFTGILISEALNRTENNKSLAARMLGITRQTLTKYNKKP